METSIRSTRGTVHHYMLLQYIVRTVSVDSPMAVPGCAVLLSQHPTTFTSLEDQSTIFAADT
jgi:hypothetical protein